MYLEPIIGDTEIGGSWGFAGQSWTKIANFKFSKTLYPQKKKKVWKKTLIYSSSLCMHTHTYHIIHNNDTITTNKWVLKYYSNNKD